MSEKKGCTVEVIVNMYDENGERISQTDTDWYGLTRDQGNFACRDLVARVSQATVDWENARAGGNQSAEDPRRR